VSEQPHPIFAFKGLKNCIWRCITCKAEFVGLAQGSPKFFARGPHKLLHSSSRAEHLT